MFRIGPDIEISGKILEREDTKVRRLPDSTDGQQRGHQKRSLRKKGY
jgi:hypothetical protein